MRGGEAWPARRRLFDAHLHIIDPRFALVSNHGYRPVPFTVADYRARVAGLGVTGGAVVSGSFHGFDQAYLIAALAELGPNFVGVAQLPTDAPAAEIERLDAAGVRAIRVNLYRRSGADLGDWMRLARRVYDRAGWHTELYVDAADLAALAPRLAALPRLTIDHLGLRRDGYASLLRLVEAGVRVKASGFGRVRLPVTAALREIAAIDPTALMFGTDLPGTRAPRAFEIDDIATIQTAVDAETAARILEHNARRWYLERPP